MVAIVALLHVLLILVAARQSCSWFSCEAYPKQWHARWTRGHTHRHVAQARLDIAGTFGSIHQLLTRVWPIRCSASPGTCVSHTSVQPEAPQPGKVSLTALRPLLLSALSVEWAIYGKLRAGLGLRGSPAAGWRPILGHGRVGRQAGCSAPASPPANSARALPSAPLHVPHTGRCTAPLATSSPKGSARR